MVSQPSEPTQHTKWVRSTRRNPNAGWRGPCEAGTAINDEFGKPLVQHCGEPGRWFSGAFLFGMVLCPEHESLQERVAEMAMHVQELREKKQVRPRGRTDV